MRFKEILYACSEMIGWSNHAKGITTYKGNQIKCDLISEYGKIVYDDVNTQSQVYWTATGAKKQH